MKNRITLTLLAPAVLATIAACGPGAVGEAARPKDPTAAGALGEDGAAGGGECTAVSPNAEVLVLDWKDEQRADLEVAMKKGVAVVQFDCKGIKLLTDCSVKGQYGFAAFSLKQKDTKIDNSDNLQANLPMSVANMSGELKRGSTIDLAYVMVGQKGTTIDSAARADLAPADKCKGATHIVREAKVGAFAFGTGTKGEANVAIEILGKGASAGSSSSKSVSSHDGDMEACKKADENATSPTARCQALVKLKLGPVVAEKAKAEEEGGEQAGGRPSKTETKPIENPCNEGYVQSSDGKCTKKSTAKNYLCNPKDVAECAAQCDKGSAESCYNAASLQYSKDVNPDFKVADEKSQGFYEKGCNGGHAASCGRLAGRFTYGANQDKAKAQDLLKKGCFGGDKSSCSSLGTYAEMGFFDGTPNPALGLSYKQKACNLGLGYSCAMVAKAYIEGKGVAKNATEGLKLLMKSCDAGDNANCRELGNHYMKGGDGITKDGKKAEELFKKSCDAGSSMACDDLGTMYANGIGVPKAPDKAKPLFEKGCPEKYGSNSCVHLGELYEKGEGVTKDKIRALDLYEQSCPGLGCAAAAALYEKGGNSVKKDPDKAASLYERACTPFDNPAAPGKNKEACAKAGTLLAKDKAKAKEHFGRVCGWWHDAKDCAQFKALGGTPTPPPKPGAPPGPPKPPGAPPAALPKAPPSPPPPPPKK